MLTLGCNFWAIEIVRRMKRVAIHIVYIEKHTFSYNGRAEKYTYTARTSPYSLNIESNPHEGNFSIKSYVVRSIRIASPRRI